MRSRHPVFPLNPKAFAPPRRQRGASLVLWTVALLPLLAVMALAVDTANMFLGNAELQNAADAGALAGAAKVQQGATTAQTAAVAAATANRSQGALVETSTADVTVGCWTFVAAGGTTGGTFSTTCTTNNAVKVVTKRSTTMVAAFFGTIIGFSGYNATAEAIAYYPSVIVDWALCKTYLSYTSPVCLLTGGANDTTARARRITSTWPLTIGGPIETSPGNGSDPLAVNKVMPVINPQTSGSNAGYCTGSGKEPSTVFAFVRILTITNPSGTPCVTLGAQVPPVVLVQ